MLVEMRMNKGFQRAIGSCGGAKDILQLTRFEGPPTHPKAALFVGR